MSLYQSVDQLDRLSRRFPHTGRFQFTFCSLSGILMGKQRLKHLLVINRVNRNRRHPSDRATPVSYG
jgi:hypothetical protein